MADCPDTRGVLLARSWIVNGCEEHMMGTEKNESMDAPIPAPQAGHAGGGARRLLEAVGWLSRRCLRRVRSA